MSRDIGWRFVGDISLFIGKLKKAYIFITLQIHRQNIYEAVLMMCLGHGVPNTIGDSFYKLILLRRFLGRGLVP